MRVYCFWANCCNPLRRQRMHRRKIQLASIKWLEKYLCTSVERFGAHTYYNIKFEDIVALENAENYTTNSILTLNREMLAEISPGTLSKQPDICVWAEERHVFSAGGIVCLPVLYIRRFRPILFVVETLSDQVIPWQSFCRYHPALYVPSFTLS